VRVSNALPTGFEPVIWAQDKPSLPFNDESGDPPATYTNPRMLSTHPFGTRGFFRTVLASTTTRKQ